MKKILYLITSFDYGGAQKNLLELARAASKNGFMVATAALKDGGVYQEKFENAAIKRITFGIPSEKRPKWLAIFFAPFYYFRAFVRLLAFTEKFSPDVIHSFLFQANIFGRLAAFFCRAKNVSSVRVMEREKKWQWIVSRLTNFMTDAVTVNSQRLYDFVLKTEGVGADKIFLVNNCIDVKNLTPVTPITKAELGLNQNDYMVVSAARLSKQKGFEYLIEAVNLIKDETERMVRVVIVGDGPSRSRLQNLINSHKLENLILFLGARSDAISIIAAADLFVLPSLWEGFPNVVLEAIAAGVPVVATDTSNVEGFIEKDFIAQSANAVILAEKILFVMRNPDAARNAVKKSVARLVEFSSENVFPKYFEIYKSLKEFPA